MAPQDIGRCYRRATAIVCACNLIIVFCIIYVLFIASSSSLSSLMLTRYELQGPKNTGEAAARYQASLAARRAVEPLELIKRVKEINDELYQADMQSAKLTRARKKYAVELSERLNQLKTSNATTHQQAFVEWQRRKVDKKKANTRVGQKTKQA